MLLLEYVVQLRETEIYFIRHAETEENGRNEIQGQKDTHLSDIGVRDASRLREDIETDFDAWYASDLKRAQHTAGILKNGTRYDQSNIEITPELREREFGEMQGESSDVIDHEKLDDLDPEGGEDWHELYNRIITYLEDIAAEHRGEQVAVVAHKGPAQSIIGSLEDNHDRQNDFGAEIANLSATVLTYSCNEFSIQEYNTLDY